MRNCFRKYGCIWVLLVCLNCMHVNKASGQQYFLKNYSLSDGLAGISVSSIIQDSRGYIWIGTMDGGLSRFDGKTFVNYTKHDGIGDNAITCLYEDRSGNIWIGTENNGVTKFNGFEFEHFDDPGINAVDKIYSDTSGNILIYTFPDLYKIKGDSIILSSKRNSEYGLQNFLLAGGPKAVKTIIDKRGNKWVASHAGISFVPKSFVDTDDQYAHAEHFILNPENPEEPASCIMQDREGNIWIGTPLSGAFMFYDGAFSNFNNLPSLRNTYITAFTIANNALIIGTPTGIKEFIYDNTADASGAQNRMYRETPVQFPGFTSTSRINALYSDPSGDWIAADENGNILIHNKKPQVIRIPEIPEYAIITAISSDAENNIWVGTDRAGIFIWNNGLKAHYTGDSLIISNAITALYRDAQHAIWIATMDAGVMKYENDKFTAFTYFDNGLISNNISCITQDANGMMWFGSPDEGICSFDGSGFAFYTDNDVLTSNNVNGITFDIQGNLWVALNDGVDHLTFNADSSITTKHFDAYDGFTGIRNNRNTIIATTDGHVWFGTVNGLFRYNPEEDVFSITKPVIELRNIRLYYENPDWALYSDSIGGWYNLPVNLHLPYDQNHVTFDFSAIFFSVHEKIQYAVMLEGFDDTWQNIGTGTSMTYSNLKPGNYTFQVRAQNADGVWSDPVTYKFSISKPFWLTWWFIVMAVVVGLSIIAILFWWRNRRFRIQAKLLEQTVMERTAELENQKVMAEKAAWRAERSEKAKEEFLANMSHEIRTPMNAIMGMTRLLLEKEPKSEQLKYLKAIRQSSDNLLVIINDILDLSKIQAGKMELEKIPFNVRSVLNNMAEIMKFKSDEKKLDFKVIIDPAVPEFITGDQVRLNQILINLTGNAIKFTDHGHVYVYCKAVSINENTATVSFDVEDTGIGIAEDKLNSIFESFSQADVATTRKFGGTGLGLSISKRLTELAGGEMRVSSTEGKGSVFSVVIPYPIAQEMASSSEEDHAADIAIATNLQARILLVEDNMFNQMVATDSINDMFPKAELVVADNGQIAVDKIVAEQFDVVLMDVQMPVMDGYTASRTIRALQDEQKSKIPIIAMTASVIKSEVDKCYESGMDDFIAKPFDKDLLQLKIIKYAHRDS
ncbi:MAG TPA: two-component regulator propeller domain-containing protein [Chitinophagales bacterium]|nr:response regulator [Chitinophagales bacterium]HNI55766.1 two-component regulator propeller domain-containing protein [Chitinophagales bacterium]HNM28759.1 two-component regulator propeller domain-containing protein [Chitinophagales bacterium]HNO28314.1 two-component regulator propeller domain-containing protein [Chitinophagales bacterium]